MRQAGRYLPEYNARARAGRQLHGARAQSRRSRPKSTLQPLERFPLDAAILFSDILTDARRDGARAFVRRRRGTALRAHDCATSARSQRSPCPTWRSCATCSTRSRRSSARSRGRVPLIGFAGSPFTLACYMIEGGGSADFATVRRMAYARPDLLARLVDVNARAVAAYLDEQIDAGADAVMMFDTWGGLLTADAYRRFSLAPMRAVLDVGCRDAACRRSCSPRAAADGSRHRRDAARTCVGLDWTVDLARRARARRRPRRAAGQPRSAGAATDPATVAREARAIVRAAGAAPGHIFNLGHGIVPATPPENVAALVDAVHARPRRPAPLLDRASPRSEMPANPRQCSSCEALDKRCESGSEVQLCTRIGHSAVMARCAEQSRDMAACNYLTLQTIFFAVVAISAHVRAIRLRINRAIGHPSYAQNYPQRFARQFYGAVMNEGLAHQCCDVEH